MKSGARWLAAGAIAALATAYSLVAAQAQSCPAPLANAKRLILVTAPNMNDMAATMRLYERASAKEPWRALDAPEPATIGRSFGVLASSRPDYLHVTPDTICVNDVSSPAYNTIASRARVGPAVHAENMSRILPMYRRGLLVDYPTDARKQAGSCIFIHVWRSPTTGTAGCVAMPEPRVEALQDFAAGGAVVAVLPRGALDRLPGCLPKD